MPIPAPSSAPLPQPSPHPTAKPNPKPTSSPHVVSTRQPTVTAATSVEVPVKLTITTDSRPTGTQVDDLKTVVAEQLSVAEDQISGFTVDVYDAATGDLVTTIVSARRRRNRQLLQTAATDGAAYRWEVSFTVAVAQGTPASDIETALGGDSFEGAVESGLGIAVTVEAVATDEAAAADTTTSEEEEDPNKKGADAASGTIIIAAAAGLGVLMMIIGFLGYRSGVCGKTSKAQDDDMSMLHSEVPRGVEQAPQQNMGAGDLLRGAQVRRAKYWNCVTNNRKQGSRWYRRKSNVRIKTCILQNAKQNYSLGGRRKWL